MKNFNEEKLTDIDTEKSNSKFKIMTIIFSILSLGLLIGLIVAIIVKQNTINNLKDEKDAITNEKDEKIKTITEEKSNIEKELKDLKDQLNYVNIFKKSGIYDEWYNIYGIKNENISYGQNDKIPNTYKEKGRNYKSEIGNVNGGNDYTKTERNIYDLYIPKSAYDNPGVKHGVILFVHGGAWTQGDKSELSFLPIRYAKMGYITATLSYTLLIDKYKNEGYNIYRIMDEISACFHSIKEVLKSYNFEEANLEFAIGGYSAGGHLSLLYTYNYIKEENSDIKFIINVAGPISIEPKYYYKLKEGEEPLDINIYEQKTEIEKLIEGNKFDLIYDIDYYLVFLNIFSGGTKTQEQLNKIIKTDKIDTENEDYQFMYNFTKYAFAVNFTKNDIPLLCYYGGKDQYVGVAQYSYLKDKYAGTNNIELVYIKYTDHMFFPITRDEDTNSTRIFHSKVLEYANKYFSHS